MGCDIHAVFEFGRTYEDNKVHWDAHSWSIDRNYSLFGRLAGVRREPLPETPSPRGVPLESSYRSKRGYFMEPLAKSLTRYPDYHNAGWLSYEEIKSLAGDMGIVEIDALLAAMVVYEDAGYKTRLVFWFDN